MVEPLARRVAELASGHVLSIAATPSIAVRVNTRTQMLCVVQTAIACAKPIENIVLVVPLRSDVMRAPFCVDADDFNVVLKYGVFGTLSDQRKIVLLAARSAAEARAIASAIAHALLSA